MHSQLTSCSHVRTAAILALSLGVYGCSVEKTRTGKLPDVDVDVEGGRLPRFNIEGPDVKVGLTERTVTVPKLVWVEEQEEIKVPFIDIDLPGTDRVERTVVVDVQVPHAGYDVEIKRVLASQGQLWVISELHEKTPSARKVTSRVSDQIIIKAPEDLNIRRMIIGEKPEGVSNGQYTFVSNQSALDQRLSGGKVLYSRNT